MMKIYIEFLLLDKKIHLQGVQSIANNQKFTLFVVSYKPILTVTFVKLFLFR